MMSECALWYIRYHVIEHEVHASEHEAAMSGAYIEQGGHGVVLGVQFPDGRAVKCGDWSAFAAAAEQADADEMAAIRATAAVPKPAERETKDPFQGRPVKVLASDPAWLGAS